jgi:hypothetical protein
VGEPGSRKAAAFQIGHRSADDEVGQRDRVADQEFPAGKLAVEQGSERAKLFLALLHSGGVGLADAEHGLADILVRQDFRSR